MDRNSYHDDESRKKEISNYCYEEDILRDAPNLRTIKEAIPKECFQSNILKSMYYVAKDTLLIAIFYVLICYLERLDLNPFAFYLIYPIYWYIQGTMFTSFFVLGHDCGHGSFSRYTLLNDIIGNILHTFILAPYYPWLVII